MICLDLNTLKAVWVQDTLDDTNCTPVLSLEGPDHHPYVYTSTSFHPGWRASANSTAPIPIWKIDAVTGQIVAQTIPITARPSPSPPRSPRRAGHPGPWKNDLEGLVFVPVAMTEGTRGKLVALNTSDMSVKWECDFAGYPWSSPVAVYDDSGKGYLIQCNKTGYIHLIDGQTGEIISEMSLAAMWRLPPPCITTWWWWAPGRPDLRHGPELFEKLSTAGGISRRQEAYDPTDQRQYRGHPK